MVCIGKSSAERQTTNKYNYLLSLALGARRYIVGANLFGAVWCYRQQDSVIQKPNRGEQVATLQNTCLL